MKTITVGLLAVLLILGFAVAHDSSSSLKTQISEISKKMQEMANSVARDVTQEATTAKNFATAAANRKELLKKLIKEDPKSAMQMLMKPAERMTSFGKRTVEPAIAMHFEQHFDSVDANFWVIATDTDETTTMTSGEAMKHAVTDRFVVLNDESSTIYEAHVYGQMEASTSRNNIRVRGFAVDNLFVVDEATQELNAAAEGNGSLMRGVAQTTSRVSVGSKTMLMIKVDFSDRPGDPVSDATLESSLSTTKEFMRVNSYGQMTLASWRITPVIRMPRPASAYQASTGYVTLLSDAVAAARSRGFSSSSYSFHMICFAPIYAGWTGRGYVGVPGAWLNGAFQFRTLGHEFGHNLGLWHANTITSHSRPAVPFGGSGSHFEYGDLYDLMGTGSTTSNHFNLHNKFRLGWVPSSSITTVSTSGTYTIYAHDDIKSASSTRGLKILYNKNNRNNYWYVISYRGISPSSYYTAGVGALDVHMTYSTYTQYNATHLIDTTPTSSGGRTDSAIALGNTFTDNGAIPKVSIQFVSKDCSDTTKACKANVKVTFLGTQTRCIEQRNVLTSQDDAMPMALEEVSSAALETATSSASATSASIFLIVMLAALVLAL